MGALPQLGDVLDGTYEIVEQIGQGGFGAVFRAKHLSMDRDVALKMLLTHGPKPEEMIERFRREVMAIRNLSHPNTVRIFDYRDTHDQSTLYYTMEYLKGITLKDLTRHEGPQSPRRIHHILRQVTKSLSEAHAHGIVHRDLKPANVMLVQMHGEVDFVKVLDFGIAKIMDEVEGGEEDDPLTSAGMLVGTLRYMAPEQITGAPLGPHTDIYALGLIAAELVAGQSVFAGTGRWEILQKQVSKDPIELPAELAASPLCSILNRMLAKEIQARYATTLELLRDLNALSDSMLSPTPLVGLVTSGAPRASHSNISHLHPPHTPSSSHSISSLSSVSQKVPVAVLDAQAVPIPLGHTMEDAPTMISPSDSFERPKPQLGFAAPAAAQPVAEAPVTDSIPLPGKGRTPLIMAVVALALLLTGGIVFLLSQSGKGDVEGSPERALGAQLPLAEAPSVLALQPKEIEEVPSPKVVPDPEPQEERPKPKQFTLTLQTDGAKGAQVFDGSDPVGKLEAKKSFIYTLEPDTSKSLSIKAKGYKDHDLTLAYDQPLLEIPVVLEQEKTPKPVSSDKKKEGREEPKKSSKPRKQKEELDDIWNID